LLLRLQRRPPLKVAGWGLIAFALAQLGCAVAPRASVVVLGMVLAGLASGIACSFAQAALFLHERTRGNATASERAAARWALGGALGDVAAPVLLALAGVGWRGAYATSAAITAVVGAAVLRASRGTSTQPPGDAPAPAPPPRFTWRELLHERAVLLATLAAAICTLLDEIVLGIGALWLDERFALTTGTRSLVLGGWTAATLVGIFVVNLAIERVRTTKLLLLSGVASAAAFAGALASGSPLAVAALLVVAGFFASWHWPLCEALALRASGDRPLLAAAASSLWTPFVLAAPLVVAGIAGALGTRVAMTVLLVQPLAMMVAGIAFAGARRSSRSRLSTRRASPPPR